MQTDEFRRLMGLLHTLGAGQRAQLQPQLIAGGGGRSVTAIIEGRVARRPCCPRCGASHVVRNGHADALQRYKCRDCDRSFNALTETPLAGLRHREKWLAQASVLDAALSVRSAAAQMGVHRITAFAHGRRHPLCAECRVNHRQRVIGAPNLAFCALLSQNASEGLAKCVRHSSPAASPSLAAI